MRTRTSIFHKLLWLLALLPLVSTSLQAQELVESRKINRGFKVSPGVTVDVNNKYGKLHVISWEKDSVVAKVEIRIRAKNEERLERLKQSVDFDFRQAAGYVTLITRVEGPKSDLFTDIESFFTNDNSMEIDYTIYVPSTCNLHAENKFGDLYCDRISGEVAINLSHGDLKATEFSGNDVRINLRFGDGRIKKLRNGRLELEYVENFNIRNAGKISLDSKASKLYIDEVEELRVSSKRDKFNIQEVGTIRGKSSSSDFRVEEVTKEVILDMRYGELYVESFAADFSYLSLDSKYTDLSFQSTNDFSYQLDLRHRNVDLDVPDELANLQTQLEADEKTSNSTGTIGRNKNAATKFRISAENSDVRFFHR